MQQRCTALIFTAHTIYFIYQLLLLLGFLKNWLVCFTLVDHAPVCCRLVAVLSACVVGKDKVFGLEGTLRALGFLLG